MSFKVRHAGFSGSSRRRVGGGGESSKGGNQARPAMWRDEGIDVAVVGNVGGNREVSSEVSGWGGKRLGYACTARWPRRMPWKFR